MYDNIEFRLYSMTIRYCNYVRQYVVPNITSVFRNIRIHFLDEVYNLIRNIVSASATKGNIRSKYITGVD